MVYAVHNKHKYDYTPQSSCYHISGLPYMLCAVQAKVGATPLHVAIDRGHSDVVIALLNAGALADVAVCANHWQRVSVLCMHF